MYLWMFYGSVLLAAIVEWAIYFQESRFQRRTLRHEHVSENETQTNPVAYHLHRYRFALCSGLVFKAALLALHGLGILPRMENFIYEVSGDSQFISGILWGSLWFFILSAFQLVCGLYRVFIIETYYGFSRYTVWAFLKDQFKMSFMGYTLLCGAGIIFWGISQSTFAVAVKAVLLCVIFTAVQFFLAYIYPVLIMPVFSKLSILENEALKTKIKNLFERIHLDIENVYVSDQSQKSSHTNAYMTGYGKYRKLVLTDTLLDQMKHDDHIVAVVAHEAGHALHHHVFKSLCLGILSLVFFFGSWYYFEVSNVLNEAFGLQRSNWAMSALLPMIFFSAFTFWIYPVENLVSRYFETQADLFSLRHIIHKDSLKQALLKLTGQNMSLPKFSTLFTIWFMSHPSIAQRVSFIENYQEGHS